MAPIARRFELALKRLGQSVDDVYTPDALGHASRAAQGLVAGAGPTAP